jgi:hypothetical protein
MRRISESVHVSFCSIGLFWSGCVPMASNVTVAWFGRFHGSYRYRLFFDGIGCVHAFWNPWERHAYVRRSRAAFSWIICCCFGAMQLRIFPAGYQCFRGCSHHCGVPGLDRADCRIDTPTATVGFGVCLSDACLDRSGRASFKL